ncbi:double-strand-break repair protein rad21-like protein 1 [Salarias fasciatus]|uniref:double-strand-break repair protein rad21-like protein 1 n=1 Tax=Salarias fasciatus TaxID=181472 RepID=UPI0011765021|nr:double-strand-break repair protein rad21-like protein 1 [Salarias fasciatus]
MFYTQLLSKRGPLAKIWLAAHWERKLTKANVFECNLETTIRDIISPKMKIGLRTSGHLLLGVVRIYSKKANYLLTDCNNALVKIKVTFRPGQTDLPQEGLEAATKAITLVEGFSTFDDELPHPSDIDIADHFSLNQSRSEEITLKEDFENNLLTFTRFGEEPQGYTSNLLDTSLQSLTQHGDRFGDEDRVLDLLDIPDHMDVQTTTINETTLLSNDGEAFALEPVAVTPNSERKRGRRRRKLVVDDTKELSDDFIRGQLNDYSDLLTPLDLAPPTVQLMQWKENGGADKLFSQPCSAIVSPQINELFAHSVLQMKSHSVCGEVEEMRPEVQRSLSSFNANNISEVSSVNPEKSHVTEPTVLDYTDSHREDGAWLEQQAEPSSEVSLPPPPSEDSVFVHPSFMNQDSQSTSLHTQSLLNSQDFEERRVTRRAQKLLAALKQIQSDGESAFSLKALCRGCTRSQAANMFACFILLKKRQALRLHQSAPYKDILATPGPAFHE